MTATSAPATTAANPAAVADAERLPLRTKLAFGVGSAAEAIALYAVTAYALLFYNQVQGVPAHWLGIAISVSLVLDGLTEPIVGSWSDRTRSKWGRRHPWMYAAPIPIALSFYAIFAPPSGLTSLQLAIWCGVSVGLLRQVMTFFHTPHLALGAELSPHYVERSKVMAYNSFFGWAGASAMAWIALTFFFPRTPEFRNGLLNPEPWQGFATVFALAVVVILFASALFTHDRIPTLPRPAEGTPKFSAGEFGKDVWKALQNRNYLWLLIGYFFLSMMIGLRESLRLHAATFYWQFTSEQLRWFIVGSFAGYATAFIFAARMHGRYDKKRTAVIACLFYAVVPAIPLCMGMAGILTPQTPYLLAILIAFGALGYGALSVMNISVMSMLADVADENELRFGVRQEGILYSTRALSAKIDQAIGTFLAGMVLLIITFPEKAQPGRVDAGVLYNLAMWEGALAAIPGVLAAVCYGSYGITKQKYEATRAALAERRRQSPAASTAAPEPAGSPAATPAE